jgi:hypothetical protein
MFGEPRRAAAELVDGRVAAGGNSAVTTQRK